MNNNMAIEKNEQHNDECITVSSVEQEVNRQNSLLSRKIEESYRSFFKQTGQAYFEIDKQGKFSFFNNHLCEMMGYENGDLKGKSILQFLDKEDVDKVKTAFKEIYETGTPKTGFVIQVKRKDGQKRELNTSVCLNTDIENRKTGFKGIALEISERKRKDDQLNQTCRMQSIGNLAAGIAHEINTPIQFIGDNIQFLKDSFGDILELLNSALAFVKASGTGSNKAAAVSEIEGIMKSIDSDYLIDEIPRAIEQSINGLQRVSEIVQAMKQFCHPGMEEKQASDLNAAIKNVVTVAKNEWKYVADLVTELNTSLPLVPCKLGEINQVILNLIINAVHAIKDVIGKDGVGKGTIKITTGYDDSYAEIRVSDTGTGIPNEIRHKIFDPFFTTKEVGKGTGQGLAISQSIIVNNHGGTINFETEMGRGTTMIVRIPLRGSYE
jgi:PAS domain S-box-containing protein